MRSWARTVAERPLPSLTGANASGAPRGGRSSGTVRAAPRLRTRAVTSTSAAPSGSRRVTIPGASTSLAPSGRIVTSRSMPPKLNQMRCQPVAFIARGRAPVGAHEQRVVAGGQVRARLERQVGAGVRAREAAVDADASPRG